MNLKKIIFSTKLMAFLFIVFALSMGIGTFVESIYDTPTARKLIYNAFWFETIIVLFVVNFSGNIFRYKLYHRKKWAILLLHLAFVFIIVGAFVTRYISYEGVLPIREGETANSFISDKTYLTVYIDGDINGKHMRKTIRKEVLLSNYFKNNVTINTDFNEHKINIRLKKYFKSAKKDFINNPKGVPFLKLVESSNNTRHNHYLKEKTTVNIHNLLFSYNNYIKGAININTTVTPHTIELPFKGDFFEMKTQQKGSLAKDMPYKLKYKTLYTIGSFNFVLPNLPEIGTLDIVRSINEKDKEAIFIELENNNITKHLSILGGKGYVLPPQNITLNQFDIYISYGSIEHTLPFKIKLNNFIAEKYPGTENSYASFESEVTIIDTISSSFDYNIHMNHILDHKGYRFFQASFDPDEKGSILSVNYDFVGTGITYFGYTLLYIGLIGIIFYGDTRFRKLSKNLKSVHKKLLLVTVLLSTPLIGLSQHKTHTHSDSIYQKTKPDIKIKAVDKKHVALFSSLVIQDHKGRMKPINTYSSELLRKISKKNSFENHNADQFLLSILLSPEKWYYKPCIYLEKSNDSIRAIIGVSKEKKYAKIIDFFDTDGKYKLAPYLHEAYATNKPNKYQKDLKNIDQRLSLLNQTISLSFLNLFPIPNHPNNKWISPINKKKITEQITDSLYQNYIQNIIKYYRISLTKAIKDNDYSEPNKLLKSIIQNQKNHSAEVLLSDTKIVWEIIYNKFDIFNRLFKWYLYIGLLLISVSIIQIFNNRLFLARLTTILKILTFVLFTLHTLGLIFRWYISNHAPWSDAYESMIYVAWWTLFMGVLFSKRSTLTLAATTFITSIVLMIAHWNWLDPAIANLQPVLNSYWLMIHVAIIVGSYGPFTLSMIIGVLTLLIICFTNSGSFDKTKSHIKELTIINELSMTIGLIMLTIGNFLGGQWANESWGRYWGWDPKETWALISIMVYAFILHMRFIPKLKGVFTLSLASIIAYASIMMTYFGVNFYLVGLHSYASGEKIVMPSFVYCSVIFVVILGIISHYKNRKLMCTNS